MTSHKDNLMAGFTEPTRIGANTSSVLPPTVPQYPTSESDAKANAHNASIIAVRGLHITAPAEVLYALAGAVLQNTVIPARILSNVRTNGNAAESTGSNGDHEDARPPGITFEPFYFFFYGSLQIPRVLSSVCDMIGSRLAAGTTMRKEARLKGWKVKMWGPYPALVPVVAADGDDEGVLGSVWYCDRPEYVARLCRYETDAYRMAYCDVSVPSADGNGVEVLKNARTFVSTLNDHELADGWFDAEEHETRVAFMWGS